jgi:hypothetical protein
MIPRRHVLWLCLCACAPGALPPPRILSIAPSEMVACEGVAISLQVDAVLPTHLDYDQSATSANPGVSVRVGTVPAGGAQYSPAGEVTAVVPPVFAPGTYDVGLRLADDRPEAVLPQAFTVKPNPYPLSYRFDFIADQTRDNPFPITIRAVGPNASAFNCTVALSSNRGILSPQISGSFQAGVRQELVVVSSVESSMVINALDDGGRTGSSNPFRVGP